MACWTWPPTTKHIKRSSIVDLEEAKKNLEEERRRLSGARADLEPEVEQEPAGGEAGSELSSVDQHPAEQATETFEREKDLSIENNIRDLLRKIEGALKRMDAGTYGLCERCGKPIEKARIKALPYAELCIKDAQAAQSRR